MSESQKPYLPPLEQLLMYGDGITIPFEHDYSNLGFTREHITELIRMATDPELNNADFDDVKVFAPVHAWRILGQLKAEASVLPLLGMLDNVDDWASEIVDVIGNIGTEALAPLKAFLSDTSQKDMARADAAEAIQKVAENYPEHRSEAVQMISDQLAKYNEQAPELNAFLIGSLITLNAVEAAPIIENAFRARKVDSWIIGNWGDVEVELGLKETPAKYDFDRTMPKLSLPGFLGLADPTDMRVQRTKDRAKAKKAKNKKKMAKASQKKNRRKK